MMLGKLLLIIMLVVQKIITRLILKIKKLLEASYSKLDLTSKELIKNNLFKSKTS